MFKNIFVLLLCTFVAESRKETYEYVPSVGRYIKMHIIPANWQEARLRCHLEGGILASPEDSNMLAAMSQIMNDSQVKVIYTGIHATYSKGDYTTVTGTSLSEIDVEWHQRERRGDNDYEDCLVMHSSEGLADVKCTDSYQFICHKSPEKMDAHSCTRDFNNSHSDYVFNNKTGSCYKFHKGDRPWRDAFKTCQAEDAYLAVINSVEESQILRELFAENPPYTIHGFINKDAASIGFTRWPGIREWFTIHGQSLTEAGFAVFSDGPDKDRSEECGSLSRTGFLDSQFCNQYSTFICEKPALKKVD